MKANNLNGISVYTSKLNGTEVYIMADESLVRNVQSTIPAYIIGGQIFVRLADKLNMKFDEEIVRSVTQDRNTNMLIKLKHRSVDLDTLGTISRNMIKDYILSSIYIEDYSDGLDMKVYPNTISLVYTKS